MIQNQHLKALLAALAAGTLALAAGCSDGTSIDNPPGTAQLSESGKLLQAPVKGAKVCIDLDGNGVCGPNEPFTTSDANGQYTISGTFQVVGANPPILSEGGLVTNSAGTEVPARNMSAPSGAKVVSMLTTLEMATPPAQRAALVAQLNALAGGVDYHTVDFFTTAVPRELMVAVKTVEAMVGGFESLGAGSAAQQKTVLAQLGTTLANAPTLTAATIDTALPTLVNTAAQSAFAFINSPTLQVSSVAALGDAMGAIATSVAGAIPAGTTVSESTILAAVENATKTSTDSLASVVTSWVKLDLSSVTLTSNVIQTWTAANLPTGLTLASLPNSLAVTAAATNTTGAAQTFNNVTVKLTVAQATRSIVLSIGGLTVNVASNGTLTLTKGTAPLVVQGLTSNGTQVLFNMADTTWGTASGATVTFDLNALNTQLQANGGRDLNTLASSGNYVITAEVTGAPYVAMTKSLALSIP